LIDLGLPIISMSTENICHNLRPIAYMVAKSESTDQISKILLDFQDFLLKRFNYNFKPEFIMSDNSDAIISGCSKSFKHSYVHMLCHFHLYKRIKEKTSKNNLKDLKPNILFGIKPLKNSKDYDFFQHVWQIVSKHWKDINVPQTFIDSFEAE